ncbi:MAG: TetR/AcrR family transcriptional regulator, partial [Spirochaetaceae bacterium]|nr:TetR/AcrR family transcriptional regulator [Spirochaetaceae bacterium]
MSRERKFGDSRVIIAEALRLIEEEGYLSFSTRRLAARLGLTAMSLYTYYDSRERLLEDAVALGFEEFIAGMTEFFAQRGGAGTLRGLRVVSEYMVKFAHERTNVYRFLFSSDLTALHGDPRMKRYSNYILEDIQRTHPEGELSKDLRRRVGLFMTLVNAL